LRGNELQRAEAHRGGDHRRRARRGQLGFSRLCPLATGRGRATGRPVAEFGLGWGEIHTVTCDTPACDTGNLTEREDPRSRQRHTVGQLKAMVVNERGVFTVTAEPAPSPEGFHLRIGEPAPAYERLVLWHCTDIECTDRRRFPLHTMRRPPAAALSAVRLAVMPDGTVLVAAERTIVSLRV
jgi:hypothetical protein